MLRNRKAKNIVKKPDSRRRPTLARSAVTTARGTPLPFFGLAKSLIGTSRSPLVESTSAGKRIASTVPTAKMTKANRSAHEAPMEATTMAMGAATAAPTTPAIDIRPLADTRVMGSGKSRGVAAALVTL